MAGFLFGQAGMRYDAATGEYRTEVRVYDPVAERFDSQDPADAGSNLYEPFGDAPQENVDPSGLCDSAVSESPSTYINDLTVGSVGGSVSLPGSPTSWASNGEFGSGDTSGLTHSALRVRFRHGQMDKR